MEPDSRITERETQHFECKTVLFKKYYRTETLVHIEVEVTFPTDDRLFKNVDKY